MEKSKLVKAVDRIADQVTGAYEKIEQTVVDSYKKVEETVVSSYDKVEDAFVGKYLVHDGETVEEARARLKQEQK